MNAFHQIAAQQAFWPILIIVIIYLTFVMFLGLYFSRFSSNINDFFFSGQRFSWWIPSMSLIATGIGSYSYLKYSQQGLITGMSSTHIYFNDWFLFPVFIFAWVPILYFNRIKSIPDYFERRFNATSRYLCVCIVLAYTFYYIGFNLFTLGVAIEGLFGLPPIITLPVITLILGIYVTTGGQTAVVFTDVFQGIMLYLVGFIVLGAGLYALGGFAEFWSYLPETHRLPLAPLSSNLKFNTSGIFWGDALAGGVAFVYMNQGFIMRYLTIRNVHQVRTAAMFQLLVSLPISATIIGGLGWIAKSILNKQEVIGGALAGYQTLSIGNSYDTFLLTAYNVIQQNNWVMGFIFAALIAALMSTADSLINASAAIGIYDIYKPLFRPKASDKHYLNVARIVSIVATLIGLLLVVWFYTQKGTFMSIHYKGIMVIIPPVVTTIFLGILWKNFHAFSANISICIGIVTSFSTLIFPEPVYLLREWMLGPQSGDIIFFRAPYSIAITTISACVCQWIFPTAQHVHQRLGRFKLVQVLNRGMGKNIDGLTASSINQAMFNFKGSEVSTAIGSKVKNIRIQLSEEVTEHEIALSREVADKLKARENDLIYVADQRWFLGGVRSGHFKLKLMHKDQNDIIWMSKQGQRRAYLLDGRLLFTEKTI